jgi:hypothetical protein
MSIAAVQVRPLSPDIALAHVHRTMVARIARQA